MLTIQVHGWFSKYHWNNICILKAAARFHGMHNA